MDEISQSIIKTLCYSDIFDYPLTEAEIVKLVIAPKKLSPYIIHTHLEKLHQDGAIRQTGSYFHLPGQVHTVTLRTKKAKYSKTKFDQVKKIATRMMKLPFIKAIFLTGTVAVNNAAQADDIDIMVVTAKDHLWTCRLFVILWLDLQGIRRHPNEVEAIDKICPNLFLDSNTLAVPQKLRNLYTAHEVIQTKPLSDPDHLYQKFLSENTWITQFLPNINIPPSPLVVSSSHRKSDFLEFLARNAQLQYMKHHQTREIVTPQSAYFHPKDTAGIVLDEYDKRVKNML